MLYQVGSCLAAIPGKFNIAHSIIALPVGDFVLTMRSVRRRPLLTLPESRGWLEKLGAPGKIRTYGLLLRRQTLYPD